MNRWYVVLMLAWIAWMHGTFPSKGIDRWEPTGATETLDECKQASVTAAGNSVRKFRAQNDRGAIFTHTGAVIEVTYASGEKASFVFVCLPETMDPRGPKGK
jgi:hypothetical protein